jgi:hypothetical protein
MTEPLIHTVGICGWGSARADLAQIAALRKAVPRWAPEGTPGHFLKHADEQTVVAVSAVDRAIEAHSLVAGEQRDWTIIAAPRFIGRLGGVATLTRFSKGGGPAISPHVIPQHSLHSVSGALSILLATRAPNFGVGGGAESVTDGLFAAWVHCSLAGQAWLVCTAWEPEPIVDPAGNCTNAPACHAIALALQSEAAACRGQVRLQRSPDVASHEASDAAPVTVMQLAHAFEAFDRGLSICRFQWRLPWGGLLVMEAGAAEKQRVAA